MKKKNSAIHIHDKGSPASTDHHSMLHAPLKKPTTLPKKKNATFLAPGPPLSIRSSQVHYLDPRNLQTATAPHREASSGASSSLPRAQRPFPSLRGIIGLH